MGLNNGGNKNGSLKGALLSGNMKGSLWARQGLEEEQEWRECTVVLDTCTQSLVLEFGAPQEASSSQESKLEVELTSEYFVGDSERAGRDHSFLVSDLVDALYLSCTDDDTKREWMQAIAASVHQLMCNDSSGPRQQQRDPQDNDPNQDEQTKHMSKMSLSAIRAEQIDYQYRASLALLDVAISARQLAKSRAERAERAAMSQAEQVAKQVELAAQAEEAERASAIAAAEKIKADKRAAEQRKLRAEQQAAAEQRRAERRQHEQEEAEKLIAQKRDQTKRRSLKFDQKSGGILSRIQGWNNKVDEFQAGQAENVFSDSCDTSGKGAAPLKPGDAGYGHAKAGSKTAERAVQAKAWVEKEVNKLLDVLDQVGEVGKDGKTVATFGQLFLAYENVSDALVGILMRAKKRKLIAYQGDMLFQGVHNDVVVTRL